MTNANVVGAVMVCGWGIFLFFTFHHWLESVRTTLEPGLRQARLANLRIRWLAGLILGPIFFFLSYWLLARKETGILQLDARFGWIFLIGMEIYFLIRFWQLNSNFRKYALTMKTMDLFSAYFSMACGIFAFLSVLE